MKTALLLDVPKSQPSFRARVNAFKKEQGIETYRSPHMHREDHPWIAIVRFDEHKSISIGETMANYAGFYEDSGLVATGEGELSAIRQVCNQRNIHCPL